MSDRAPEIQRVHLLVTGRVQGVYYRASTAAAARRLGLTGWVRNLSDGRVEAIAEGHIDMLHRLVDWCRDGPPHARVDSVLADWSSATGEHRGFTVRR